MPEGTENGHPHKNLYMNVYSIIPNSQMWKQPNSLCISQWMDKQNVVYPHNEILFNHKKEQSADKCSVARI